MCWIRTVVIFFFLWVLVSLTEGFLLRPRSIFATTFKKASFPSSALTPAFRPSSHGPQQYEDFSDKSIVDNERPGVKQEAKMSRRVYVDDTKRGKKHSTTRRKAMDALKSALAGIASSTVIGRFKKENDLRVASAAPPIAIIAEELGYFPVTNRHGKTTYVPARVKRSSTDQAVLLAKYLKSVRSAFH